jgi:hypothetical protein
MRRNGRDPSATTTVPKVGDETAYSSGSNPLKEEFDDRKSNRKANTQT